MEREGLSQEPLTTGVWQEPQQATQFFQTVTIDTTKLTEFKATKNSFLLERLSINLLISEYVYMQSLAGRK